MRAVRVWLPVGIVLLGLGMIALEPNAVGLEAGAMAIGAGLSVWLLNLLFRVGVAGDRERDAEDAARDYFERHGRWPDEEPAPSDEPPPGPRGDASGRPSPGHRPPPHRGGRAHPPARRRG